MEKCRRYSFRLYELTDNELADWIEAKTPRKGMLNDLVRMALIHEMENEGNPRATFIPAAKPQYRPSTKFDKLASSFDD